MNRLDRRSIFFVIVFLLVVALPLQAFAATLHDDTPIPTAVTGAPDAPDVSPPVEADPSPVPFLSMEWLFAISLVVILALVVTHEIAIMRVAERTANLMPPWALAAIGDILTRLLQDIDRRVLDSPTGVDDAAWNELRPRVNQLLLELGMIDELPHGPELPDQPVSKLDEG